MSSTPEPEPKVFESMEDSYAYFFRLDRIEEREDGRYMIGVARSGGITKGTDYPQEVHEDRWRRAGWRPTSKQVPGW